MTRSVADAAVTFEAIAGHDPEDATSLSDPVPDMLAALEGGVADLRIGYDAAFSADGVDPGLVAAIEQALAVLSDLGARIVEIEMPEDTPALGELWFPICSREAFNAHRANFPSRATEYGLYFRDFLTTGQSVSDAQYADAMTARTDYSQRFEQVLATVDTVLCPSGGVAFQHDPQLVYQDADTMQVLFENVQMQFTIPADFAGTPTLTLPCGFTDNGIPYALQLMGPRLSEATLCRIGHAYESATDWHNRHPDV